MKKILALAASAVLLASAALPAAAQNVQNYTKQGGAITEIGGALNILSGGVVDLKTGSALKVAGTDVTATLASAASGVAAGYKIARGETALTGTNPTTAATGLTAIVACSATIKLATAPGVGTSVITYGTSGGTLSLYAWKVTSSGNPTLIASTGTETVGWVCLGT